MTGLIRQAPALGLEDRGRERWFDTTQFVNPPDFTFGNVGRTSPRVRVPGNINVDFSAIKNNRIRERWNVQFRAESFNFANHVNLLSPDATFVKGNPWSKYPARRSRQLPAPGMHGSCS